MVSRYSIIQYVPNPIANERINIGVVAFTDHEVRVQFLANWERVYNFGMENIDFLKNFAERMEEAASRGLLFPGDEEGEIPKHERLTKIARGWRNSIQFTEPHGSIADVDKLLKDIVEDFLIEPNDFLINKQGNRHSHKKSINFSIIDPSDLFNFFKKKFSKNSQSQSGYNRF